MRFSSFNNIRTPTNLFECDAGIGLLPACSHASFYDTSSSKRMSSFDCSPRMVTRRGSIANVSSEESNFRGKDVLSIEKRKQRFRNVHFETDEQDKPIEQVYTISVVPQHFYSELYYSRQDLKEMMLEQKMEAKNQLKGRPELVDCIYFLHGYDVAEISPDKRSSDMGVEVARAILALSDCRGLEPYMVRLLSKRRRWGVQTILSVQELCRKKDADVAQTQMRIHLWSVKVGSASGLFAQRLGKADEIEAAIKCPTNLAKSFHTQSSRTSLYEFEQDKRSATAA